MTGERDQHVELPVVIRYNAAERRIYVKVPGCPLTHIAAKPTNPDTHHRELWQHFGECLRRHERPAPAKEE